jgi:hypothetical protein
MLKPIKINPMFKKPVAPYGYTEYFSYFFSISNISLF